MQGKYHSPELCKEKLECIVGFLGEIQTTLEYPKTDREQWVRGRLELEQLRAMVRTQKMLLDKGVIIL